MAIIVDDTTGEVTFTEGDAQIIIDNLALSVNTTPVSSVVPSNDIEQIIVSEGPEVSQVTVEGTEIIIQTVSNSVIDEMYIIDHGILKNLTTQDDHPQYINAERGALLYTPISHILDLNTNPHNLQATGLPGLSNWGLTVSQVDKEFILANMANDAIPSTQIEYLVAGKIAAGVIAAKIFMGDIFTASAQGNAINDDQSGIAITNYRIQLGYVYEDTTNTTYMLRHCNGYQETHPEYRSNFNLDSEGNLKIRGNVEIIGGLGIGNLSDAGILATRDTTSYFLPSSQPPADPIIGDVWYKTDLGNLPSRFNGFTWDLIQDEDIAIAQGTADGKINTYFQPEEPTHNALGELLSAKDNGDIWVDTDETVAGTQDNLMYYYDDSNIPKWISAQDSTIAATIVLAQTAQSTADGKIATYFGTVFPVGSEITGIGDLFYNETSKLLYRSIIFPLNNPHNIADWEIVSNAFDETGLLDDTANLGGTAVWDGVTGTNRPEDYADVTNIGGSNYVLRGFYAPNTFTGDNLTEIVAGAGNWGISIGSSTLALQLFTFSIPALLGSTDYALTFWASGIVGSTFTVDLFPAVLPSYTVTITDSAPTKYKYIFNSSDASNMAISDLRMFKVSGDVNASSTIEIYDIKFEYGTQPTDWSPFNPATDQADGTAGALEQVVTIANGGIIFDTGGSIHSLNKDSFADITSGVYLGWDNTENDYVFKLGNGTNYISWSNGVLSIVGSGIGGDYTNDVLQAGTTITGGGITLDGGGAIRSRYKDSYNDPTAGFFMGWSGSAYTLGIGNSTNYLQWNGSTLSIAGTLKVGATTLTETNTLNINTTATDVGLSAVQNLNAQGQADTGLQAGVSITAGGITMATSAYIKAGKSSYSSTTAGFFLGSESSVHKFNIGNSVSYMKWTGSNLQVRSGNIATKSIDINPGGDNEMHFYGNDGSGVVELATLGLSTVGTDTVVMRIGSIVTSGLVGIDVRSNSRNAIYAASATHNAIIAYSASGTAAAIAASGAGIGVKGYGALKGVLGEPSGGTTSGLYGYSKFLGGYALQVEANGYTDWHMRFKPGGFVGPPGSSYPAEMGTIYVGSTGRIWINTNGSTAWKEL